MRQQEPLTNEEEDAGIRTFSTCAGFALSLLTPKVEHTSSGLKVS
jgi:hypothetical protein